MICRENGFKRQYIKYFLIAFDSRVKHPKEYEIAETRRKKDSRTLDSRYELPSRRTIMRMLPEKYFEKCEAVKEELSRHRHAHVAVTSDLWTSRATESYLTITCHLLTSSWELKSLVLDTFQFEQSHTAENISAAFLKSADKWNTSSNSDLIASTIATLSKASFGYGDSGKTA